MGTISSGISVPVRYSCESLICELGQPDYASIRSEWVENDWAVSITALSAVLLAAMTGARPSGAGMGARRGRQRAGGLATLLWMCLCCYEARAGASIAYAAISCSLRRDFWGDLLAVPWNLLRVFVPSCSCR